MVIDPEAPPIRPQRHIPNSIATIRRELTAAIANRTAIQRRRSDHPVTIPAAEKNVPCRRNAAFITAASGEPVGIPDAPWVVGFPSALM